MQVLKKEYQTKVTRGVERIEFEIVLENRYPVRDPQITCHTSFTDPVLSLADGRDLYTEIVGENGWQKKLDLFKVIFLLPDFVEDMLDLAQEPRTKLEQCVGSFKLGHLYHFPTLKIHAQRLGPFYKETFECQVQSELNPN